MSFWTLIKNTKKPERVKKNFWKEQQRFREFMCRVFMILHIKKMAPLPLLDPIILMQKKKLKSRLSWT